MAISNLRGCNGRKVCNGIIVGQVPRLRLMPKNVVGEPDIRSMVFAQGRAARVVPPHQRRVRNKPEPRFDRKHGGVLTFGLQSRVQRS